MSGQERMQISGIAIDAGTQARIAINEEAVSEYAERMEAGDEFPPVIVFHDGSVYYLADGFHRILAALRIGAGEIWADVRKGAKEDALWYALGANKTNGLRPSAGDKRRAVELALKTWPDKTQQAIADHVGCARPYVTKIQEELVTSDKLDVPATRMGADGKEYPTSYKKREPKPQEGEESESDNAGMSLKEAKDGYPLRGEAEAITQFLEICEPALADLERVESKLGLVAAQRDRLDGFCKRLAQIREGSDV